MSKRLRSSSIWRFTMDAFAHLAMLVIVSIVIGLIAS